MFYYFLTICIYEVLEQSTYEFNQFLRHGIYDTLASFEILKQIERLQSPKIVNSYKLK